MIGVFDSGIGGLSILRALRAELPGQRFIYVADSGHAPYGERDAAHVIARSQALARYLAAERGACALVVACNTATAAAIAPLRAEFPALPIIGVEPALKPAVALSRSGHIGVMATRGTLASTRFAQLLGSLHGQAQFTLHACDGLASAIERSVDGQSASAAHLHEVCSAHVQAMRARAGPAMDTVVLGCTHYPLALPLLALLLPGAQLLDPGQAVARQTRLRLQAQQTQAGAVAGKDFVELLSTGDATTLARAARRWIDPLAQAQHLALD